MKLYICLLMLLIPCLNYGFKKNETPYPIVISKAVLIVDGTVSKISKNEYQFTITQFIKGKSSSKINVVIWKEWLCDPRIKELKAGQRLILFLEKTPYGNFAPINDSTGEIYIDNDTFINRFLPKEFSNAIVLKKGISMFLQTYIFYENSNNRSFYFTRNKSIFEIYNMTKTNMSFNFLVDNVEYYKPVEIQQLFN
ncbi:hypothetical protein [Flavobacterium reichenbachii]|nr:hypothetical protein [Flavobacterium reichenbachii]